ncbi:MAG: hypothetical protein JXB00_00415 [Bacteroidales bacterium]|nr:hypothetical protein [Bacteroidales bacterium]
MKNRTITNFAGAFIILMFAFAGFSNLHAQIVEKLIIYENFGGSVAGSSVSGIQPDTWPAVHADSGYHSGWYKSSQNLDNKGNNVDVPQFYGNGFFHIDSVQKYRTGGLSGLDITVDDFDKTWTRNVPFRNGYKMPLTSSTSLGIRLFGVAALPELSSWISYAPYTPVYLQNQTDESGYLYLGKNVGTQRPVITIPASDFEYLENISRMELLISGSRLGHNNTISVRTEELDSEGVTIGGDTLTFSASIEPRLISVPINKEYVRIYIQSWGSSNSNTTTDFALLDGNTKVDTRTPFNWNAIYCVKPTDGTINAGQTSNPGVSVHMIKIYAKSAGTGYTITTNNSLVTGTTTGIAYGQTVQLTAQATSGVEKFMGWKISGKPDLSEVVNPLNITVTSDMTIMPVYSGDMVEVPVVNENFTNWVQQGTTVELENNRLNFSNNPADPGAVLWTGTVKVPFRYGFTAWGKDSVNIMLNKCNVIPQYGPRVYNIPGSENYSGYVAFMGPNLDKGYVAVDSLTGITKTEVDVSSYDLPSPDRACAIKVNGSIVRNKTLRTLYPEQVIIDHNPASVTKLQIGPGNQARCEYLVPASPLASIDTGSSQVSAAAVALHNLKIYAAVTMPELNYYKLTMPAVSGGKISGYYPAPGNSTNHYIEGTKVTLTALPQQGYGFDGWVDGSNNPIGLDNPITITMDADKTIKPVFDQKPSYIKLIASSKGTVTTSIEPMEVRGDTMVFLAGVPVTLTATPVYGYKFTRWIKNSAEALVNPLTLTTLDMGKLVTNVIEVVFDSITTRETLSIANEAEKGEITFNHTPEDVVTVGDTTKYKFPSGETIEVSASPLYGYGFSIWKPGLDVVDADTANNPVSVIMTGNKIISPVWEPLPRKLLVIETVFNGSVTISDVHKDGELEQQGLWPENYYVELTLVPADGYMFSAMNAGVSYIPGEGNSVKVRMDQDTVKIAPIFTVFQPITLITENFQDASKWIEPEGNVSNVVGARQFLNLGELWNPTTYNNNLEGLLQILSYYRVWGSESNDNSDGPNGTKLPYTTLLLNYQAQPLTAKVKVGSTPDSIKLTAVRYSTCNNCLIGKAVKESNITNYYLGHVTPGMLALKKPNVVSRSAVDYPAFMPGDSIGMLLVEGLAYVEKLEIGYVSSSAQFCPGVFYTTEPLEIIDNNGLFAASFGELPSLGQLSGKEISARPDQGNYGWGCSQEGMIMDQNMTIAEEGVQETRILITAGYKPAGDVYAYSDIYIHDLRIWGSPIHTTGVNDMIVNGSADAKFYMLGTTNMLKIDVDEPVKTLVVYNMDGKAVKVVREIYDNLVNLSGLKSGVYAVHSYGVSGKMYTGSFGKAN